MNADTFKVEEESPGKTYQRFDKEIGSGSFKKVFLGFDTKEGRQIAWCRISMKKLSKPEKKRIFEETTLLQKFEKHERILSAIACWYNQEKDEVVIINQLYPGGSLKEFIVPKFDQELRRDKIKYQAKYKWCHQILEGIQFLHSRTPPILHRDLKCDNIFYDSSTGNVLIGDLGLSKAVSGDNTRQTMLGTPEFMAPEVYKGSYGSKADMYAFGLVLLELFTGKIPFEEFNNIPAIMAAVCENKKPNLLAELKLYFKDKMKEYDPIYRIIESLLDADPDKRPSAQELLDGYFKYDKKNITTPLSAKANVQPKLALRNIHTMKGDDDSSDNNYDFNEFTTEVMMMQTPAPRDAPRIIDSPGDLQNISSGESHQTPDALNLTPNSNINSNNNTNPNSNVNTNQPNSPTTVTSPEISSKYGTNNNYSPPESAPSNDQLDLNPVLPVLAIDTNTNNRKLHPPVNDMTPIDYESSYQFQLAVSPQSYITPKNIQSSKLSTLPSNGNDMQNNNNLYNPNLPNIKFNEITETDKNNSINNDERQNNHSSSNTPIDSPVVPVSSSSNTDDINRNDIKDGLDISMQIPLSQLNNTHTNNQIYDNNAFKLPLSGSLTHIKAHIDINDRKESTQRKSGANFESVFPNANLNIDPWSLETGLFNLD